ncbi:hypothetical protein LOZ58_006201 [Ophidiomyces ophidiicola]|nr:hypothetical protein LOZ65_004475 [Ophidiomyces ophidiicola]KAI1956698.1 hypothetical protein LOZ58_006201 [Ophidiomyces ophidiicola]
MGIVSAAGHSQGLGAGARVEAHILPELQAETDRKGGIVTGAIRGAQIVIEKLTKNVNEGHLREIFGTYGDIQSLDLPMNRQFMTNRGSAYICYYDAADAESAIAHMHEAQLDGAVLSVSIVLPRRTFDRTPPPARMPARPEPWRSGYSATGPGRPPSTRYRSPPPPRRQFRAPQTMNRHDIYRPRVEEIGEIAMAQ